MVYDKAFLRNRFLLQRKKKYLTVKKFNFNLIFQLIRKHFKKRKITIAAYYPTNYEVNILRFIEAASKKNFRIVLPVIKSSSNMCFKPWIFKEPLYMNNFGILEPRKPKVEIAPNLILVPLVSPGTLILTSGRRARSMPTVSSQKMRAILPLRCRAV